MVETVIEKTKPIQVAEAKVRYKNYKKNREDKKT